MGVIATTKALHELEAGVFEIIGKDEAVAASQYSASVGVGVSNKSSGEIQTISLYSTETGTGAVQAPAGTLFFLDADPATTAGDTALTAAEHKTILGAVDIVAGDWQSDANGAVATAVVSIKYHQLSTIYVVFKLASGATTINSAAGDDEIIEGNFWYEVARNG